MKKLFNVNSMVSMRLTQKGADILNEQNEDLMKRFPTLFDTIKMNYYNEGDSYTCQLWEMMNTFGGKFYAGSESPFVNCEILLDEKFLNDEVEE